MRWKHRVIDTYINPASDESEAIDTLVYSIKDHEKEGWRFAGYHRYSDGLTMVFMRPDVSFFAEAIDAVQEALESFEKRTDARFVAENIVSIVACIADKGESDEPDSED